MKSNDTNVYSKRLSLEGWYLIKTDLISSEYFKTDSVNRDWSLQLSTKDWTRNHFGVPCSNSVEKWQKLLWRETGKKAKQNRKEKTGKFCARSRRCVNWTLAAFHSASAVRFWPIRLRHPTVMTCVLHSAWQTLN